MTGSVADAVACMAQGAGPVTAGRAMTVRRKSKFSRDTFRVAARLNAPSFRGPRCRGR
jgi:hypothetical protein